MNTLPMSEEVKSEIESLDNAIRKAIETFNENVGIKIKWVEVSTQSEFTFAGELTTYIIESNVHD